MRDEVVDLVFYGLGKTYIRHWSEGLLKETKWLVVMSRNTVAHRLKPNTMVRFTSLEILIPLKPMARTGKCRVDWWTSRPAR